MTDIFNAAITTEILPDEWKIAKVTPISKSGIFSELSNYRPISIIPIVAKAFEKIIYDQLYKLVLNDNNLFSNCQSGFQSLHSTLTALKGFFHGSAHTPVLRNLVCVPARNKANF